MEYLQRITLSTLCLIVVSILFYSVVSVAFAQLPGISNTPALALSPQSPRPQSSVTVSIQSFQVDVENTTIRWFVDGVEAVGFENETTLTVRTGDIGETTVVEAVVEQEGASIQTFRSTIRPGDVDLIIEADTTAPSFYKGRALPSVGSRVYATAVPHIESAESARNLTYTWKLNGSVLFGGPVRGKQRADFELPTSFESTLGVEIADSSGVLQTQKTVALSPTSPFVLFYEDNPLRGTGQTALEGTFTLSADEITVRALPYFMSRSVLEEPEATVQRWEMNNRLVENPNEDAQSITLRGVGSGGRATLTYEVRNLEELLQFAKATFTIFFN